MFKLMGKKIVTILRSNILFIYTYEIDIEVVQDFIDQPFYVIRPKIPCASLYVSYL